MRRRTAAWGAAALLLAGALPGPAPARREAPSPVARAERRLAELEGRLALVDAALDAGAEARIDAQARFDLAAERFRQGDVASVRELLTGVIDDAALAPHRRRALWMLGESLARDGRPGEAAAVLARLADEGAGRLRDRALARLVSLADHPDAVRTAAAALERARAGGRPPAPAVALAWGQWLLERRELWPGDRLARAEVWLARAAEDPELRAEARFHQGRARIQAGDPAGAASLFEEATARPAEDREARQLAGQAFAALARARDAQGRLAEALAAWDRVPPDTGDFAEALVEGAGLRVRLGDAAGARAAYAIAREVAPGPLGARAALRLAALQAEAALWDEALGTWRALVDRWRPLHDALAAAPAGAALPPALAPWVEGDPDLARARALRDAVARERQALDAARAAVHRLRAAAAGGLKAFPLLADAHDRAAAIANEAGASKAPAGDLRPADAARLRDGASRIEAAARARLARARQLGEARRAALEAAVQAESGRVEAQARALAALETEAQAMAGRLVRRATTRVQARLASLLLEADAASLRTRIRRHEVRARELAELARGRDEALARLDRAAAVQADRRPPVEPTPRAAWTRKPVPAGASEVDGWLEAAARFEAAAVEHLEDVRRAGEARHRRRREVLEESFERVLRGLRVQRQRETVEGNAALEAFLARHPDAAEAPRLAAGWREAAGGPIFRPDVGTEDAERDIDNLQAPKVPDKP